MAGIIEARSISSPDRSSRPMRGLTTPGEDSRFNWGKGVKPVYERSAVNEENGHIPARLVGPDAEELQRELKLSSEPVVLYRREGSPINTTREEHIGLST